MTTLLAHQGGWDEILLVAGPIAVVVGLLAVGALWLARSIARELAKHGS